MPAENGPYPVHNKPVTGRTGDRVILMSQSRGGTDESNQTRNRGDSTAETGGEQQGDAGEVQAASSWFATTAVRTGLTAIGVVLLLFALGQAVGLPLLELAAEAVTSQTGRWLVVAFFAVLLIAAAQRVVTTN